MQTENDKTLADFFYSIEKTLDEKPVRGKSYASRVVGRHAERNPLTPYVKRLRASDRRFVV